MKRISYQLSAISYQLRGYLKPLCVVFLLILLLLPFYFYLFTSPAFAQDCYCDVNTNRCSVDCGNYAGFECTTSTAYICQGEARTPEECKLFPDRTWVAVFRACVDLGQFINMLLQWAIILAAAAAAVMFVVGGIQYITSTGDPRSLENAHATMTSAIFGLVIVVIAWLVMKVLAGAVPPEWEVWFGISP